MFILHHHPERNIRTQIHSLVLPQGVKTPTVGTPGRGPACLLHLFLDGHLCFTDSTLHGDLFWESRLHVHRLWLRHDPALCQRTGWSLHCALTIEGHASTSPSCLPAPEETQLAPSPSSRAYHAIAAPSGSAKPSG